MTPRPLVSMNLSENSFETGTRSFGDKSVPLWGFGGRAVILEKFGTVGTYVISLEAPIN